MEKFKAIGERIKGFAGYIGAGVFLWGLVLPFVLPYWNNRSSKRLDIVEEILEAYAPIVEAETDIDAKIYHSYGIELRHCNKDEKGRFTYSFVKVDGVPREAIESRTKAGVWVYKSKEGRQIPIITLKHE